MRENNLQQLVDLSRSIVAHSGNSRAIAAFARVSECLIEGEGSEVAVEARRLPVCLHSIDAALAGLAARAGHLPELAASFAAVEAQLRWDRRRGATPGDAFFDGHANAMIIGPGGIEEREDVWVGASVVAPGVTYPEHDHPPEEVYIALSPGEWWNSEMPWTEPGPGGVIYNPPGIRHAMRAHGRPLLALWFLPVG